MKVYYKSGNIARWFINTVWDAIRCGIAVRGQVETEIFFKNRDQKWIPNREEVMENTFNSDDDFWDFQCERLDLKTEIAKAVLADPKTRIPVLINDLESYKKMPLCRRNEKHVADVHIAWLKRVMDQMDNEQQASQKPKEGRISRIMAYICQIFKKSKEEK
jgi:hypothetical protein